jgi:eukaryotic-like serine/threonine-protein kinase
MPYKRIACLGSGFFGEVWLEADVGLNRECAAKYLNPTRLSSGVVFAEAQVMLDAQHDNVVRVYSADTEAGIPVIRMEYLPAGSVANHYNGRPLPTAEALHVLEEACRGVEALHARGVLHRDLKPANLLIKKGGRIKVSDFGLACGAANVAGAPPWGYTEHLPPEALIGSGGIDTVRGDVYALGVTLYRLLNGDDLMRIVAAPGADVVGLIAVGKYPDRTKWQPHIHDRLRRVTRKAMHQDPTHRYNSASELRHALEGARPKMSWVPVTTAGHGLAWEATAPGGGSQCRARLGPTRQGKHLFEIERQGPGGHFRTSRSDSLAGSTHKEVLAHAEKVLQRVATEGR